MAQNDISVGDWIYRTDKKGIWQIYRILKGFYENRYSLKEEKQRSKRVIVFAKRLWFSSVSRQTAFNCDCCEVFFVRRASDSVEINRALESDEKLRRRFEIFANKSPNLVTNLSFNLPDSQPLHLFCASLSSSLAQGLILDEVLRRLETAGLADRMGKNPRNASLQLTCREHEVRDDEHIIREARILPF